MAGEFNIEDYMIGTDDGSGELVLEKTSKTPDVSITPEPTPTQQPEVDKFVSIENNINNLLATQQRQSNAISTLIQALMQQQQAPQEVVDQETLSDVFTDPDKGKTFLNTIEKSIERIVSSKFDQLQPIVQQSSIKAELDQLAGSVPDLALYAQGMHQILGINPNLTFQQAYVLAKQYGWKVEPQQEKPTTNQQQQNLQTNVADINQRRQLPPKLDSSNAQLKSKEVKSVRDAMEIALEELGA